MLNPMIKNIGKIFNPQKLLDDVGEVVDKAIVKTPEEKADYNGKEIESEIVLTVWDS